MNFRLRKDARAWFKVLEPQIQSNAKLFEMYYFCLCAGLTSGQKADAHNDETDELVDYFPGEFRSRSRILTAWLISKELEALGISVQERVPVHQAIRKLVDPQSSSFLSELGMQEMNRYASGGFEVLSEQIPEAPRSLAHFLIEFHESLITMSEYYAEAA